MLYFGSARAGTVLMNLSIRQSTKEVCGILALSGARMLFQDGAAPAIPAASITTIPFGLEFESFMNEPVLEEAALSPDDPYCVTYTGGTTGQPRGVLVSHRARAGQSHAIAKAFGFKSDDVVCVSTPMTHVAGLFVCFQPAIAVGATCVLMDHWDAGVFLDLAERHGITTTVMVPTQLIDILAHETFRPEQMRSLQRIIYAGAPMPALVLANLLERLPWIEFIENYGQSELGALTVRRGVDLPIKAGSIGQVIDGVELAVLGPTGKPVEPGEIGELCSRGPNALTGYDREPEKTEALYKYGGNWIATGDAARCDADGFFYLVERLRDMIIRGGENLYPTEIENALFSHPAVAECAVIGMPDKRLGEVPLAFVVGNDISEGDLLEYCAGHLARHKVPAAIRFIDALPKTAVGKVRKNVLRDQLA